MTHAVAKLDQGQEQVMARQLTEQYQRAVGGLWEGVKFGAMMLHLQATLNSARGIQKGQIQYEGSLKQWIKANCPDVSISTAWRFMALADGVRNELSLGEKVDLSHILTADEKDLAPKFRKIRAGVASFLEGKSQRQLLFKFGAEDPKKLGGDNHLQKWLRENHPKLAGYALRELPKSVKEEWRAYLAANYAADLKTPEAKRARAVAKWETIADLLTDEGIRGGSWKWLERKSLENIHRLLTDVAKEISPVIK